uniref:hypothetical protein n=1 Tax=Actinomyces sp. 186855 TaxID=2761164 RepID=UPI0020175E2C
MSDEKETIAARVFRTQREYSKAQYALEKAVLRSFGTDPDSIESLEKSPVENWSVEQDSDYD